MLIRGKKETKKKEKRNLRNGSNSVPFFTFVDNEQNVCGNVNAHRRSIAYLSRLNSSNYLGAISLRSIFTAYFYCVPSELLRLIKFCFVRLDIARNIVRKTSATILETLLR